MNKLYPEMQKSECFFQLQPNNERVLRQVQASVSKLEHGTRVDYYSIQEIFVFQLYIQNDTFSSEFYPQGCLHWS